MDAVVQFLMQHGYVILFAAVFARQIGLPVPAPLFLLAAGALAAAGKLRLAVALGLAVVACVLADWVWYEAGRRWGDRVLRFLHHFAPSPGAAERNARRTFARYGPPLLVLAKFVPGMDAVVPPLAGSCRTSRFRFLAFEAIGAALWASAYVGLGHLLSRDLERAASYVSSAGTLLAGSALAGLSIYAGRRLRRRQRSKHPSRAPIDAIAVPSARVHHPTGFSRPAPQHPPRT